MPQLIPINYLKWGLQENRRYCSTIKKNWNFQAPFCGYVSVIRSDRQLQLKPAERIPTWNSLCIFIPSLCISSNIVIIQHSNNVGKVLFSLAIFASHSMCCLSSMVHNKAGQLRFIFICSEFYFLTFWSRISFYKWDGLVSINAVVMHLGDWESFCIQCSLRESSLWYQIWHSLYVFLKFELQYQQNSDPSVLNFWVTFQPKDTRLHHRLQIWRDITDKRDVRHKKAELGNLREI